MTELNLLKKTATLIIIILLICICIGLIIYFFYKKDNESESGSLNIYFDNIQERNYKKVGNNLYYEDNLIQTKGREDKETILNYYKIISDYMQNLFPDTDFYIYIILII